MGGPGPVMMVMAMMMPMVIVAAMRFAMIMVMMMVIVADTHGFSRSAALHKCRTAAQFATAEFWANI